MARTTATASPATSPAAARPVRVVTTYPTTADFIHGFCRAVDERHLLLGLTRPHPVGTHLRFSVHLADGTTVLHGSGRVVALLSPRHRRATVGARLELDPLPEDARAMRGRLLLARQALLIARAADDACFGGETPELALTRSSSARAPARRASPPPLPRPAPPVLPDYSDERVATTTATKVIVGTLRARPVRPPPPDDPDGEATRQLVIVSPDIPGDDAASDPCAPVPPSHGSAFDTCAPPPGPGPVPGGLVPQTTDRVFLVDLPAPPPRSRRLAVALLLVLAALAGAAGAALHLYR